MNLNKKFLLGVSLCAVAATFAVACDDAESGGMTGTAGASGSTTGKAGTGSGTAGKAGAGGASAGTGGSTTAGTGGTTTAGKGGAPGGTGGTAGKGGATGGSSGIGGSGATAGAGGACGAGGGDGFLRAALSVAHLSIDAGDVRVCAAPSGSPLAIDLLNLFTDAPTKLSFKDVTARLDIPAGTYDFGLVADSDTCPPTGTPIATVSGVTLATSAYTVMAVGSTTAGVKVVLATDTIVNWGSAGGWLRFVHGASALPVPVDVGTMMPAFTKLWTGAAYPGIAMTVAAPFTADANGYVAVPKESYMLGVGASPAATPTFVAANSMSIAAGEIATLYAIDAAGAIPVEGLKCHEGPDAAVPLLLCSTIALQPAP
ncbi:MAG: DUF4397 domain-containing protein [Polyangiaceae bacterium]|nr:DUF4397 domain-containing protein [Polyangiaceae bacterium]